MKLIKFLLSHVILLAFLVALGFAYYYRAQLFSPDINARIDHTVHKVLVLARLAPEASEPVSTETTEVPGTEVARIPAETTETSSSETSEPDTAFSLADTSVTTGAEQAPTETEDTAPVTEQGTGPTVEQATDQQEVSSAEVETPAQDTEPAEAETADPESAEQVAVVSTDTEAVFTEEETQQQVETASTDKEAVSASHSELIDQARLAFSNGNADKAVLLYKELSELNPDDPNAYGELGNVYYAQGKWQLAGQAFYEAAIRLLRQGQHGQVQYLHRVIQGLDKESADKLAEQLGN
jgi:tetratricopeptide (TPR) repeat protein